MCIYIEVPYFRSRNPKVKLQSALKSIQSIKHEQLLHQLLEKAQASRPRSLEFKPFRLVQELHVAQVFSHICYPALIKTEEPKRKCIDAAAEKSTRKKPASRIATTVG